MATPFEQQQAAILPNPQGRRKVILALPSPKPPSPSKASPPSSTAAGSGCRASTRRADSPAWRRCASRAPRLSNEPAAPGVSDRHLYPAVGEDAQRGLIPYNAPEILEADLAPRLELALWGVNDAATLTWLDPPPPAPSPGTRIAPAARNPRRRRTHHPLGVRWRRCRCTRALLICCCAVDRWASARLPAMWRRQPPNATCCVPWTGNAAATSPCGLRPCALTAVRATPGTRYGADPGACASAERAARLWRHLLE